LELHTAAAEGALAVTALALQVCGRTGSPIAASSARRFSDGRAATTVDQVLDVGMQQLSCETGQSGSTTPGVVSVP